MKIVLLKKTWGDAYVRVKTFKRDGKRDTSRPSWKKMNLIHNRARLEQRRDKKVLLNVLR